MYEVRIKLPYLSKSNPHIEKMKADIILAAANGDIPSYAISAGNVGNVSLVDLDAEPDLLAVCCDLIFAYDDARAQGEGLELLARARSIIAHAEGK